MWVRNLGVPPPKNLATQKHQNFGFCDLIANISGREQDIVHRKKALKTAIIPLRVYQIWRTLVHRRRKIGPWIRPTQSTFSDAHISAHISGANGRCPLEIFTFTNLVYFGWYRGDLLRNCIKLSYLMCPLRGIKRPHLIFGVLLPKNVGGRKT